MFKCKFVFKFAVMSYVNYKKVFSALATEVQVFLCSSIETQDNYLKDLLKSDSHLPKNIFLFALMICPSKMMKNAFYFILKALFVLKIFKFLS